jgi:molecular chaperone IbpA
MRIYDFAPLWRSSIGFDRLFDLLNATQRANDEGSPPYDIERLGEDSYRISLALAGYSPENISLTAEQNVLTVEGRKDEQKRDLLYKDISARNFKRQFNLAEHVTVTEAQFDNGLLRIGLKREVPETKKPRSIPIGQGVRDNVEQLEAKAA